ncbi:MAG: hypothetical protein COT18_01585 [Elusimicrobia bacterium CG08_land_8_20_14_0_20_59_10]|nr:MAG: hypothetical protein COT18_01585 [Elusimicrobia bacterium CG08_land_8_20_14_0_20_59_10]
MKKLLLLAAAACLSGCAGGGDIIYKPAEQKMPAHIKLIAVRPFANKTQQFGLEEKLTLKIVEEFLKNGEYSIVPESSAQGIIVGEVTTYILTPIQYDVNMVPTVYKLNILAAVRLLDKEQNRYVWEEPALQVTKMYSAANLPGGLNEEQAREYLWEILAKDVVLRTVSGFGSVSSTSSKRRPAPPPPAAP